MASLTCLYPNNKHRDNAIQCFVNIIDLIYYVPRKKLERVPPTNVVSSFRALQRLYHIPNCMIGNKYFYE